MRSFAALCLILVLAVPPARTAEEDAPPSGATTAQLLADLEAQFNRGNTPGLAALWTVEGDFTGPQGQRIEGRLAIEKAFQKALADGIQRKLRITPTATRTISPDLALVDATAVLTPPREVGGEAQASFVLVKQNGRWLIASARETVRPEPEATKNLEPVAWLVGQWESDRTASPGVAIESTCDWTANHTFLIRKFTSSLKEGHSLVGTEVIAWDPRAHRIRSWTFDSNGGFGESIWTGGGDRWAIQYSGTLADGSDMAIEHHLTRLDADSVSIESKSHTLNGQPQADMPPVKLKRHIDAPGTPAAKPVPPTGLPK